MKSSSFGFSKISCVSFILPVTHFAFFATLFGKDFSSFLFLFFKSWTKMGSAEFCLQNPDWCFNPFNIPDFSSKISHTKKFIIFNNRLVFLEPDLSIVQFAFWQRSQFLAPSLYVNKYKCHKCHKCHMNVLVSLRWGHSADEVFSLPFTDPIFWEIGAP